MKDNIKSALDKYIVNISNIEGVIQIYLFGSCAFGMSDEDSDIDLMVIIDDELNAMKKAIEIQQKLASRTVALDVLVNNKSIFNEASSDVTLQAEIKNNGVLLYERE